MILLLGTSYEGPTINGGGLVVMGVLSSGLGCVGPGFEPRNGKGLGLNPTTPAHESRPYSALVGLR